MVRLAETGAQLENDEENQVDDIRPLPTIPICCNPEDDRANGPKHEHKRDAPGNVSCRALESFRKVRDGQGDGEEVKSIPGPTCECALEQSSVFLVVAPECVWNVDHIHQRTTTAGS